MPKIENLEEIKGDNPLIDPNNTLELLTFLDNHYLDVDFTARAAKLFLNSLQKDIDPDSSLKYLIEEILPELDLFLLLEGKERNIPEIKLKG